MIECCVADCSRSAVTEVRFEGQKRWFAYCSFHDVRVEVDGIRVRRRGWLPWQIGADRDL